MAKDLKDLVAGAPRRSGLVVTALGLGLWYFFGLAPLLAAREQRPDIGWFSVKMTTIAGVFVILGILLVATGERGHRFLNPKPGQPKVATYLVATVIAAIALGAGIALKEAIKAQGYVFGFGAQSHSTER